MCRSGSHVRHGVRARWQLDPIPGALHADFIDGAVPLDQHQRLELPDLASIYTSNQGASHGAQFITFNVDGNPKKARGYFMNVNNVTIDNFTVFAD